MKREEVIGIKLECIGTDYPEQFTVGKVYEIVKSGNGRVNLKADDGWMWNVYDYENIEHLVSSLSQTTNGRFKLYKKENPKMKKKMTKAELEGKFVKCIQGGVGHMFVETQLEYNEGELYKIKSGAIYVFSQKLWIFTGWYDELSDNFTIEELNESLQTNCGNVKFEYVGDYQHQKKLRFEDLKVGDKLTLRDDLVVGARYGMTSYMSNMVNPSAEVTVDSFDIEMERIYINECKTGFIYAPEMFKEILPLQSPNKVKSDEVKPDKKSKVSEIKVPVTVHVDMLFDPPVIEETNDEVFIFSGRSTIYISKEFGIYGIATVNSKELSSYNKEIGMALAYKRCFDKLK